MEIAVTKFLFVTDLDNTLVGDDRALVELSGRLQEHRQQYGTKIVYSTGRSPFLYRELQQEKNLITPDALVVSVGTEIYIDGSDVSDPEWSEILSPGWDKQAILSITKNYPELVLQPETEQRPFKVSFFLEEKSSSDIIPQLEQDLKNSQLNIKLIYSSGIDLDILPLSSDKGKMS
ncbi:MAG: sucrose-phosphate phosphatase, partial [Nostocales cyanobacterium]